MLSIMCYKYDKFSIHHRPVWPDVNEHNLFAMQAIKFVSILNHRMHYYMHRERERERMGKDN